MIYQAVTATELAARPLGCRPGSKALIEWTHRSGFGDKGCFNPGSVVPGGSISLHVVGRGVDLCPGDGDPDAFDAFIHVLVDHADLIGIQQVLWNRQGWSATRPYWHDLTAPTDMHLDHAHTELTIAAADTLTVDAIASTILPPPPPIDEDEMTDEQIDKLSTAIVDKFFAYQVALHDYEHNTDALYEYHLHQSFIHDELAQIRKHLLG